MFELRSTILKHIFKIFPFDIEGNAHMKQESNLLLSCIIPTRAGSPELERLLHCLSSQDADRESFEVIVIEDGSSLATERIIQRSADQINIQLLTNTKPLRSVGALRNQGLEYASGRFILFLDDDTLIWQNNFLHLLIAQFLSSPEIDCIVIPGEADRCFLRHRYSYLNRYSFGCACIGYRREVLSRLGGFLNDMASYEDIELSLRFTMLDGKTQTKENIAYYHPPFQFTSWRKPITNGISFFRLRRIYSFPVWFLCYINALRFLPFILSPSFQHRQWGKISIGFLLAPFIPFAAQQNVSDGYGN